MDSPETVATKENVNRTSRTMSVLGVVCLFQLACSSNGAETSPTAGAAVTVTTAKADSGTAPAKTVSTVGSSSPDTPDTAPVPSVDVAADQAAAEAARLVLTDFDVGWSEVTQNKDDATDTDVKRRVAQCAGVDAPTAIEFGGALAKTGNFTSPSGDSVAESVSFAGTVDEAVERMAHFAAPEFATCIQQVYEEFIPDKLGSGAKLESVTVAKLNVTPTGDEMVAFRVTITAGKSGLTVELYADTIVIRPGRIIASPTFQAQFSPFDIDETERLVALAADRLPKS